MNFTYFFWILTINFEKISSISLFYIVFHEIFIKFRSILDPIYETWWLFIVIIIFHIFIIGFWFFYWSSLIPFATINSISISVHNFNFSSAFSSSIVTAGAERHFAETIWTIFKRIFVKFLKTSSKSNVSLLRYKSCDDIYLFLFISNSLQTLFACM